MFNYRHSFVHVQLSFLSKNCARSRSKSSSFPRGTIAPFHSHILINKEIWTKNEQNLLKNTKARVTVHLFKALLRLCDILLDLFKIRYDSWRLVYEFWDSFHIVFVGFLEILLDFCKLVWNSFKTSSFVVRFWLQRFWLQFFSPGELIASYLPCVIASASLGMLQDYKRTCLFEKLE